MIKSIIPLWYCIIESSGRYGFDEYASHFDHRTRMMITTVMLTPKK